ncbi:MAG: hypothetical protein ACRDD8_11435 [Bacteroidales bacterium]
MAVQRGKEVAEIAMKMEKKTQRIPNILPTATPDKILELVDAVAALKNENHTGTTLIKEASLLFV